MDRLAEFGFECLVQPLGLSHESLLRTLEHVVVKNHAFLFRDVLGEPWSPPAAYRWLRYEDPRPLGRLRGGTRRLERGWEAAARDPARRLFVPAAAAGAAQHEAGHLAELALAAGLSIPTGALD
ncbi:MAG: hypothetical protein ACREPI_04020 [Candidatus Dormibacterales bacterium]